MVSDGSSLTARHYIHPRRVGQFVLRSSDDTVTSLTSRRIPRLAPIVGHASSDVAPNLSCVRLSVPRHFAQIASTDLKSLVHRLNALYSIDNYTAKPPEKPLKKLHRWPIALQKISPGHRTLQLHNALKNVEISDVNRRPHTENHRCLRWKRRGPLGLRRNLAKAVCTKTENENNDKPARCDCVSKMHGFLAQRDIRSLLKQTNYDRRELYVMYVRFKGLCAMSPHPNGIDKNTFKKGVARLAVEDDLFVDRVFNLVDEDGSGCIEWPEFLSALSALEKGNQNKKMTFFLSTYDLDGDGFISRSDLHTMLLSSYMLQPDEVTLDLVNSFVERLFGMFGAGDKDKLSLDDILKYMAKNETDEDVWEVFGRSMLKDFGGFKEPTRTVITKTRERK